MTERTRALALFSGLAVLVALVFAWLAAAYGGRILDQPRGELSGPFDPRGNGAVALDLQRPVLADPLFDQPLSQGRILLP